jgi:regulator of nucleoside diphosphate kinase
MRADLPDVTIACSQRKRLKRLVATAFADKNRIAPFLSAELRRASFCDDEALPAEIVAAGRRVSYRLAGRAATPYRTLVYPEEFSDEHAQISLLSPIGTALLGLRTGDRTHVFLPPNGFHLLEVAGVKESEPVMTMPAIRILAADYDRLAELAESVPDSFLRRELDRAAIVSDAADDSVQMGSRVCFRDHDGGRIHDVRLVYPAQSDPARGRISILTPVGSALLGLPTGARMQWRDRGGRTKELTVLSVQPASLEASP